MTQLAKKIFLGRTKKRLDLWGRTSQRPIVALSKNDGLLEQSLLGWHLVSQFIVANRSRRNGFQHRWRKDFAKDVGRALLGRRLA